MRALLLLLLLAAPARAETDPLEAVNRRVHGFNRLAQRHVLSPTAQAWRAWVPAPVRAGIANALANLGEPVTAASALLAGEPALAADAAMRFGINTALGLGGTRDVATAMGYPPSPMSLGDALCRWGVPAGPYVVLPLLGPSSLRDAGASLAGSLALSQAVGSDAVLALGGGSAWVAYAEAQPTLDGVEAGALDSYATWRSIYWQRRAMSCEVDR